MMTQLSITKEITLALCLFNDKIKAIAVVVTKFPTKSEWEAKWNTWKLLHYPIVSISFIGNGTWAAIRLQSGWILAILKWNLRRFYTLRFFLIISAHTENETQFNGCSKRIMPTNINIACVTTSNDATSWLVCTKFSHTFCCWLVYLPSAIGGGAILGKPFHFGTVVYASLWIAMNWAVGGFASHNPTDCYRSVCNRNCIKFSNYQDNLC